MKLLLNHRVKDYLLLYFAFALYSLSSVFSKLVSFNFDNKFKFVVFLGLEILFLGIYAILWQQILKKFDLVIAMANKGSVVLFSLIWSLFLFKEKITIFNLLGALIIVMGIRMVSKSD